MQAVPVGALHDQQIDLPILFIKIQGRILYDRFIESAHIARKADGKITAVIADPYQGEGLAQNVTGII